jgi:nicotinamidase-related amidase
MSDTALLVIDVQESFRHRPYYTEAEVPAFIARAQALIDGAVKVGIPVVQVFHTADSGAFATSSGFVTTMAPLRIAPDVTFTKSKHSALVGSGLDVWLSEHRIHRLIVSGIRTEQCCETTTRHASDLGFAVDFVGEATLTFAMRDGAGRSWSAAEIRARTELVLADRFARIVTVEQALEDRREKTAA